MTRGFWDKLGGEIWRSPVLFAAVWVPTLTILILTFNPAVTATLSFWSGLAFWAFHVVLLLPLLMWFQTIVDGGLVSFQLPPLLHFTITAFCVSVVFAPVSIFLDVVFEPVGDLGPSPSVVSILTDEIWSIFLPTFCVWLLVNSARLQNLSVPLALQENPENTGGSEAPEEASEESRDHTETSIEQAFWAKIPRELGRDVVSLTSEQHYLHVATTRGRTFILFPLKRAMSALSGKEGVQIHRSHWVALPHVKGLVRDAETVSVLLSTGEKRPVSRRNQTEVKELLDRRDQC
ncbi:LytTR family DNA-binding domain-containing protein [Rhodophyticola porphyridii]|uniref:LytTR family DNA-binding domain-containing protein n=1 Tax=Rhodophyticola porphyridii TaxID=1852017 RepID=UPI0011C4AC2E|nr:LytTR family DNA-binding domain-containing protein [Rhodophyticola porphyridii]